MKNITTTFPNLPYSDNFDVEDKIYKVLFKAGTSFSNQHLNLIQSILQEQIAIFGKHFYKNGSFISQVQYQIITSNIFDIVEFTNITDIKEFFNSLVDVEFVQESTGKTFKVLFTQEYSTVFTKGEFNKISFVGTDYPTFIDSGTLRLKDTDKIIVIKRALQSSYIIFEPGIIFFNGYFLNFPKQFTVLPSSSASIGFEIKQSIISSSTDSSLLDNARGYPSEGSEGADRYFIFPKLIAYPVIQDSNYYDIVQKNEFFEYVRMENGVVIKDVTRPIYDEFRKTLAKRTHDTSGSYTVNPFFIDIQDKDDNYFLINIKRGKSYIFGHEFDSLSNRTVLLPKSSERVSVDTQVTLFNSFSYIIIPELTRYIDTVKTEKILFFNNGHVLLGSAICFYVEQKNSTEVKLYLTNISLSNNSFENVAYITDENTLYISSVSDFFLQQNAKESFLIELKGDASNLDCTYQKTFNSVLNNTITKNSTEIFPEDLIYYKAFDVDKNKVEIKSISINDNLITFEAVTTTFSIFYIIVDGIKGNIVPVQYDILEKTIVINFKEQILLFEQVVEIKSILLESNNIISHFNIEKNVTLLFDQGLKLNYVGTESLKDKKLTISYSYKTNFRGDIFKQNNTCDFRKNNIFRVSSIKPNSKIKYSFTKALGRYDKLVLTSNKTFELIHGTPSLDPIPPKDRQDAMTLYVLFIPANIKLPSSIGIKFVENKRYTMRDIGKLETRIQNLEYYTALNLLEKQTEELQFYDEGGNKRFKNGFLVDNFKTFKSVSLDSKDVNFSLDINKGNLRPSFTIKNLDLIYVPTESTTQLTGDLITLPYKEVPFIQQVDATDVITINSFSVFVFEGKMKLTPESDYWVDTETKPTVNLNLYSETDVYSQFGELGFNAKWESWESDILSVPKTETKNSSNVINFKDIDSKIEKQLWNPSVNNNVDKITLDTYQLWVSSGFQEGFDKSSPDGYVNEQPAILLNFKSKKNVAEQDSTEFQKTQILTNELSNNVTDVIITPFQRKISIQFDVTSLKPLTKFFVLFDDTDVTNLCYEKETQNKDLISNQFGELHGIFDLPEKQFKTGSHILKIVDTLSSIKSKISSFAISQFFSKGLTQTKTQTLISTREPGLVVKNNLFSPVRHVFDFSELGVVIKKQLPVEEFEIDGVEIQSTSVSVHDPLAQSFFIMEQEYPEGIFLSSVDLFFWKKDFVFPVSIELRESENSYPSSKQIIPFSIVSLPADKVFISEDATTPTNFKFNSPVFLKPGQYNLIVTTDSNNYKLWLGTLGKFKVGKVDERISKNPYAGVLFRSSNNSAWLSQQESDLTFRINRCSFQPTALASIKNSDYESLQEEETPHEFTSLRLNAVTIIPEKTSFLNSNVRLTTVSKNEKIVNLQLNSTHELDEIFILRDSTFDKSSSINNNILFETQKESVSPVIDTQRLSSVLIFNLINKLNTVEQLNSELGPYDGFAKAKYITKKISLNFEIPANLLSVSFAASLPKGTQVRVYYKVFSTVEDSSDFTIFDRPWQYMGSANKISNSKEKFIDFSLETKKPFVYEGKLGIDNFDTYMIKLVLESENAAVIPIIRDFRTVALTY